MKPDETSRPTEYTAGNMTAHSTTTTTVTKTDDSHADDVDERRQAEAFDMTTSKGRDGGLFRDCMTSIRSSHVTANRLRMGIVVAGMFTDVSMYSEVIALFYLVTKAMEERCTELSTKKNDDIVKALLSLGYHFTPDYEHDLKFLYETKLGISSWKTYVDQNILKQNDVVRSYVEHIEQMEDGASLAGAAFCLWGALIIGGGAAAKTRAEALVKQKDSLKLFQSVTGPGRNQRKKDFVRLWDSLIDEEDDDGKDNTVLRATS
jgi:Heme oxygenase